MIKNIYTPNTPVMRTLEGRYPTGEFCGEMQLCEAPVIACEENEVTMSCATTGAKIYYTIDGTTTPTSSSYEYTEGVTITEDTTFKAIAILEGYADSQVTTFEAEYEE